LALGLTLKLSPVINWICVLFHIPVLSAVQRALRGAPTRTTVDPSGLVGVMTALQSGRTATSAKGNSEVRENMFGAVLLGD
jgi:hypothetical protein